MTQPVVNQDSLWKDVLISFFKDFMLFFFPSAYEQINWKQKVHILDKELQQIIHGVPIGRKVVDVLAEVNLKSGDSAWILVHIEIQAQPEKNFAQRMFIYHYRIFERYKQPIASFAVLTDNQPSWKPSHFGYSVLGCNLEFTFPIAKILEWKNHWEELEKSNNPFAVVVMTHLKIRDTKNDPKHRLQWKLHLIRNLYQKGLTKRQIIALFHFIYGIMNLPQEMENEVWDQVRKYEENRHMPYVTSFEKIIIERGLQQGLARGLEQGLQQGLQKGLIQKSQESTIQALELRFKKIPGTLKKTIKKINDLPLLETLFKKAIIAPTLNEFQKEISGK